MDVGGAESIEIIPISLSLSHESGAIPKWIRLCKEQLKEREVDHFPHQQVQFNNIQDVIPSTLWTQT